MKFEVGLEDRVMINSDVFKMYNGTTHVRLITNNSSTKQRQPLIPTRFENEIHRYLAGICDRLEGNPVIAGGYTDHIHILCLLSKKIPLVNLVGQLKAYSSKWIKTKDESLKNLYWQDGYGAFSVNPSDV